MLTNNGKALCFVSDYCPATESGGVITTPEWNPTYELLRTNGQVSLIERVTRNQPAQLNYDYLAKNMEIIVGSGTTEATVNDYKLANEITSLNLSVIDKGSVNAEKSRSCYDENPLTLQVFKIIYNSSLTDNIVIKEIGLITKDGLGFSYLLAREVLAQNDYITLTPGQMKTFTFIVN